MIKIGASGTPICTNTSAVAGGVTHHYILGLKMLTPMCHEHPKSGKKIHPVLKVLLKY